MVIDFAQCADAALCTRLRGLPTRPDPQASPPLRCSQELLPDFKPNGKPWASRVIDPSGGASYKACRQPGRKAGELRLVVIVMGALISETVHLQSASTGYVRCN